MGFLLEFQNGYPKTVIFFSRVTEIGELNDSTLQLELVSGEGFQPVLERVLQCTSENRFHGLFSTLLEGSR